MSKTLKKIIIGVVAILAIVYLIGAFYFSSITYPNTTVNGNDRGMKSFSEVFLPEDEEFVLEIKGRDDKNLEIDSKDIDYKLTVSGKPEVTQNNWAWPLEIFQQHEYNIEYNSTMNEIKLANLIDNSDLLKNQVEPKNAEIQTNDGKVTLVDEVLGTTIDKAKLKETIDNAIKNRIEEVELHDEYVKPTILKDNPELVAEYETLKRFEEQKIVFDFVDRQYELAGQELMDLYDKTDEGLVLNEDRSYNYVYDIASETNTYNKPHQFNATGLGEITVPGGIYGWQMDIDSTFENLKTMLSEGEGGEIEIVYLREANQRETNDIGGTYIEIDLSRQTMWLYNNYELVISTPIVSGDARERVSATPTGVNMVWTKDTDRELKGTYELTGGNYTYPVKYWMPVGWTNSGIHDNWNRTEFGGNIYQSWGSNSCINTPPEAMKTIFENTPIGTAVVIYESSTNLSPTEWEKQDMIRSGQTQLEY